MGLLFVVTSTSGETVNELPRRKSWDFKCVHTCVLTLRWSAESCPAAIRLLMTGPH